VVKCTKFNFDRGFAHCPRPILGAYSTPSDSLTGRYTLEHERGETNGDNGIHPLFGSKWRLYEILSLNMFRRRSKRFF